MENMENTYIKKPKRRREPSFDNRFIGIAVIVLLVVLAVIAFAKFASLKTLFWLE